jgi:hypothetical protein
VACGSNPELSLGPKPTFGRTPVQDRLESKAEICVWIEAGSWKPREGRATELFQTERASKLSGGILMREGRRWNRKI